MKSFIISVFRVLKKIVSTFLNSYDKSITYLVFYINNIQFTSFTTKGIPYVRITKGAKCLIGNNFKINNTIRSNPIGRNQKCILSVSNKGTLIIGNNVGMSCSSIVCMNEITIGNNVMFGGGCCIYDSDFHPIDPAKRTSLQNEFTNHNSVLIGDNVFIGAHSTILKGVSIGENSVIGACSVVTKSIPCNEIWAGNPAKYIKSI